MENYNMPQLKVENSITKFKLLEQRLKTSPGYMDI